MPVAEGRARLQRVLLVPQPPLSLAHLLAVREALVPPGWMPVLVLAAFPLASLVVGVARRPRTVSLLATAVLEVGWSVLHAAMVGLAIGLRSG